MRRARDVFYINANFNENYFILYGMEFAEFIRCNPVELDNILVTEGNLFGNNFNNTLLLETINGKKRIFEISKEDTYGLGNFHWIDYDNEVDLDNCSPDEKAEILFLSHFGKPIKSAFFERLHNNFVYLAHDDGWFCKLYCRDIRLFKELLSNRIINSFSIDKRRKIYPISENIQSEIFGLTNKGLLIDFPNIRTDDKNMSVNFYAIGKYEDMDAMYDNLEQKKHSAKVKGTIEYKNKTWSICTLD